MSETPEDAPGGLPPTAPPDLETPLAEPPRGDLLPEAPEASVRVDRALLEFLICPVTHGPLVYDAERQELVSKGAHLAFPIRDGIPVMLVDEARRIGD